MGFLDAMKISSSGLAAERVRMNVISSNVANANTTQTPEGGPYKRRDVLFSAQNSPVSFDDLMRQAFDPNVKEVKVSGIVEDETAPKMIYMPQHPDADDSGMVAMPNISVMEEMVNLITSTRSFEANSTALNASKDMASSAIQIGR